MASSGQSMTFWHNSPSIIIRWFRVRIDPGGRSDGAEDLACRRAGAALPRLYDQPPADRRENHELPAVPAFSDDKPKSFGNFQAGKEISQIIQRRPSPAIGMTGNRVKQGRPG
jgi:hypothetical protein